MTSTRWEVTRQLDNFSNALHRVVAVHLRLLLAASEREDKAVRPGHLLDPDVALHLCSVRMRRRARLRQSSR